jgi:hypothetical protein
MPLEPDPQEDTVLDAPEDLEEDDEALPVDELIGRQIYRDATGESAERDITNGGAYGMGDTDTGDEENFVDEKTILARRFREAVGE